MAKALGGRVYPNPVTDIGWSDVELTAEAGSDFLFTGLSDKFSVLQWHGETFDLPPGAVLLASSALCRNQAFRFGSNAWGFQFHIETTEDMIWRWLAEPPCARDLKYASAPIDPTRTAGQIAGIVLSRWASLSGNALPSRMYEVSDTAESPLAGSSSEKVKGKEWVTLCWSPW